MTLWVAISGPTSVMKDEVGNRGDQAQRAALGPELGEPGQDGEDEGRYRTPVWEAPMEAMVLGAASASLWEE